MFLHAFHARPFVLFSGIAFLTACGGGGSDSDSDQGSTDLQLDPANYGGTPISIRQSSDVEGVGQLYSDVQEVQDLIEDVIWRLESVRYGRDDSFEPEVCAESNGNLVVEEDLTDDREHIEFRFADCEVPGPGERIRLDGTLVEDVRFFEENRKVEIKNSYDVTGSIGEPAEELAIVGSQTITGVQPNSYQLDLTVRSPSLEYLVGDRYVAIRDNRLEMTEISDSYTISMESDLVSSAIGGYVTMSTPRVLQYNGFEDCPASGHIKISGDGSVEARYGQSSGNGRGVELLLNGSVVEYADSCDSDLPDFAL